MTRAPCYVNRVEGTFFRREKPGWEELKRVYPVYPVQRSGKEEEEEEEKKGGPSEETEKEKLTWW